MGCGVGVEEGVHREGRARAATGPWALPPGRLRPASLGSAHKDNSRQLNDSGWPWPCSQKLHLSEPVCVHRLKEATPAARPSPGWETMTLHQHTHPATSSARPTSPGTWGPSLGRHYMRPSKPCPDQALPTPCTDTLSAGAWSFPLIWDSGAKICSRSAGAPSAARTWWGEAVSGSVAMLHASSLGVRCEFWALY